MDAGRGGRRQRHRHAEFGADVRRWNRCGARFAAGGSLGHQCGKARGRFHAPPHCSALFIRDENHRQMPGKGNSALTDWRGCRKRRGGVTAGANLSLRGVRREGCKKSTPMPGTGRQKGRCESARSSPQGGTGGLWRRGGGSLL